MRTSRLVLRPVEDRDLVCLHQWRNSDDFIALCTVRRVPVSTEEFAEELRADFRRDRHVQLIIELADRQPPIGTVFSYNLNLVDGHVFVSIFLDARHRNHGYGAEALAAFMAYLFESFPLVKIYFEVYEYNQPSLGALSGAGFSEEGRFRQHRFSHGQRFDMVRFAAYRDSLKRIRHILDRNKRSATAETPCALATCAS